MRTAAMVVLVAGVAFMGGTLAGSPGAEGQSAWTPWPTWTAAEQAAARATATVAVYPEFAAGPAPAGDIVTPWQREASCPTPEPTPWTRIPRVDPDPAPTRPTRLPR